MAAAADGLTVKQRLEKLNITIEELPMPAANYVPYVTSGNMVFVSGQLPSRGGKLDDSHKGKVCEEAQIEKAQEAARNCALNLIAAVNHACGGDLERVQRVVKLGGFVNSDPNFIDHAKCINGASDLMGEVFGAKGRHARAAVGVASLPFGVMVEIDGVFEISQ